MKNILSEADYSEIINRIQELSETGKKELLNYLERVRQQKNLNEHPFFGELNRKEWARLTYKHLDHHLKQFGNR